VYVYGSLDALPHAFLRHFRQRLPGMLAVSLEDESSFTQRLKQGKQLRVKRMQPNACFRLGSLLMGLVVDKHNVPLNVDQAILNVDILPARRESAWPHVRKHQKCHEDSIIAISSVECCG
jgi:hypothetical protein